VNLPVGQLARLPTVPHLLAACALREPHAAAAGVGAVRLGLQVLRLRDRGPAGSGGINCGAIGSSCLNVGAMFHKPSNDLVVFTNYF
jgi:hypothetical protein